MGTVLFAEDEEMLRRLIGRSLRDKGFEVLEAASGIEAVRVARAHHGVIHLLLTDIVMPGLTGRELAEQLRLVRPEMRVLFISGYYAEEQLQLAPGSAFLGKPFTPAELLDKIHAVLAIEDGTRELAQ